MQLSTDFVTFLQGIRPTKHQRDELKAAHRTLRERLQKDARLSKYLVSTFLQGSYRRHTALRPKGGQRSDVDIIVVTNMSEEEFTPREAMEEFVPFLEEHYPGKWTRQGRSFGIEMSHVDLDLVITSAPSEAEARALAEQMLIDDALIVDDETWPGTATRAASGGASSSASWKSEPLRISNREANEWEDTHPLAQLDWTWDKSKRTNGHFVNVVKALKWWWLQTEEETKRPKGFLLERIVGACCPDAISSVAEGIVFTLENISAAFASHRRDGIVPVLPDYGLDHMNVLQRLEQRDFDTFYDAAAKAAPKARAALESEAPDDSRRRWRALLGSKFPAPKSVEASAGTGSDTSHRQASPWVVTRLGRVTVKGACRPRGSKQWHPLSPAQVVPSNWELRFRAETREGEFAWVYWQVVNTGPAAKQADDLRGEFRRATAAGRGGLDANESTAYPGRHWIECFLVDRRRELIARSGPFVVLVEP